MFRNIKKKTKKNSIEKKVKNKRITSCHSFVFALYTLISPNLQIMLYKTILFNTIKNSSIDVSVNSILDVIQILTYFLMQFTA